MNEEVALNDEEPPPQFTNPAFGNSEMCPEGGPSNVDHMSSSEPELSLRNTPEPQVLYRSVSSPLHSTGNISSPEPLRLFQSLTSLQQSPGSISSPEPNRLFQSASSPLQSGNLFSPEQPQLIQTVSPPLQLGNVVSPERPPPIESLPSTEPTLPNPVLPSLKEKRKKWIIVIATCIISFLFYGSIGRTSGVYFVAFLDEFQANWTLAAYPSSVRASLNSFTGPAAALLGKKFGVRYVTLAGVLISGLSLGLCCVAQNFHLVIALFGILGMGTAMSSTLICVLIGQYFLNNQSMAIGIAYSGSCVGSLVFPILFQYLIDNLKVHYTFLIHAAILLLASPVVLLMEEPPKNKETLRSSLRSVFQNQGYSALLETDESNMVLDSENQNAPLMKKDISDILSTSLKERFRWYYEDFDSVISVVVQMIKTFKNSHVGNNEVTTADYRTPVLLFVQNMYIKAFHQLKPPEVVIENWKTESELEESEELDEIRRKFHEWMTDCSEEHFEDSFVGSEDRPISEESFQEIFDELKEVYTYNHLDNSALLNRNGHREESNDRNEIVVTNSDDLDINEIPDDSSSNSSLTLTVCNRCIRWTARNLNPIINAIYFFICLCHTIHFITYTTIVTILVDFEKDQNISKQEENLFFVVIAVGDLLGRTAFGWVTDKGYLSYRIFMLSSMLLLGIIIALVPISARVQKLLFFMFFIYGVFYGILYIRYFVLIHKYFDHKHHYAAIGFMNILPGILGFAIPEIIGYFRKTFESYDPLFYGIGCMYAVVSFFWLLEPRMTNSNDGLESASEDEMVPVVPE